MKTILTFFIAVLMCTTLNAANDTIVSKLENGTVIVTISDECVVKEIHSYRTTEGSTFKHGEWIVFNCSGEIVQRAFFTNNSKSGVWEFKTNEGSLLISYKNGKKNGLSYKKDFQGRIIEAVNYKNGKKIESYSWSEDKGLCIASISK